jgi:hypothetical protein
MSNPDRSIDVEKELKKLLDKKVFSPIDTIDLKISYSTFTELGVRRCKKSTSDFSEILSQCLFSCKHPGLNPCIDKIFQHKKEKETGKEGLINFLLSEGSFSSRELDNNNDFLEIEVNLEILMTNLDVFLEKKEIKIKKAVIQTALFKKEIG